MQIIKTLILSILCLIALPLYAQSQEDEQEELQEREEELEERIMQFMDEYNELANASNMQIRITESNIESGTYSHILHDKLSMLRNGLQSISYRWNAFIQLEQPDIADSEHLMELMTQVQTLSQAVTDTIASQQRKCDAITEFLSAERFILTQDSAFAKLYKQAHALSKEKKTAPQLEKIKAQEQALFARIQDCYNKCKAATTLVPQLNTREAVIEEHFYSLKVLDEKIQAMAYQSFIVRIKDHLMGLACVAIILIFINMLFTKLQAAKKARQMLKKQKEMLNVTNDYPTI